MRGKKKMVRGKEKGNIAPVIMILLGVVLIAYVAFSAITIDSTDLDAAAYLDEPAYDAANDGNVVVVPGELKVIKPVVDPDLKITLDTFAAFRHVHVLHDVSKSDKSPQYQWDLVAENDPDAELKSVWLSGKGGMGDFTLTDALMKRMMRGDIYSDFDESELPEGFHLVTDLDETVWITNAPDELVTDKKVLSTGACKNYVGCIRIRYGIWDQVEKPEVTLVAEQKPGAVLDATDAVVTLVYEGKLSSKEIHLGHRVDGIGDNTVLLISAVGLILIGLFIKFSVR